MGVVPNLNQSVTTVAYVDEFVFREKSIWFREKSSRSTFSFGQELMNISLSTSPLFPALRSDYNLSDITLVYRTNVTSSDSACSERVTFLSLRCDHEVDETAGSSNKNYSLQTPAKCVTGTCDGCHFHFLLRTPLACPICDGKTQGYRMFEGVCKFGHQEIRQVPYPWVVLLFDKETMMDFVLTLVDRYCAHVLKEKSESRRCSTFSLEIQLLIGLFSLVALVLVSLIFICWRRNRK